LSGTGVTTAPALAPPPPGERLNQNHSPPPTAASKTTAMTPVNERFFDSAMCSALTRARPSAPGVTVVAVSAGQGRRRLVEDPRARSHRTTRLPLRPSRRGR
jgi:hypothetical protein